MTTLAEKFAAAKMYCREIKESAVEKTVNFTTDYLMVIGKYLSSKKLKQREN